MAEIYIADKPTLDQVKAKVDSNLDAAISSRASQSALNSVSGQISSLSSQVNQSIIKSVQRGIISVTIPGSSVKTANVTISSVNLDRSFITVTSTGYSKAQPEYQISLKPRARLTSGTNLEFYCITNNGAEATNDIAWEVIEFS
jgi:hypothetical protein